MSCLTSQRQMAGVDNPRLPTPVILWATTVSMWLPHVFHLSGQVPFIFGPTPQAQTSSWHELPMAQVNQSPAVPRFIHRASDTYAS